MRSESKGNCESNEVTLSEAARIVIVAVREGLKMEANDEPERSLFVVVDNSNIWIEGKRLAGKRLGVDGPDPRWRLKFKVLLEFLIEHYEHNNHKLRLRDVLFVGSEPPPNDLVWLKMQKANARVRTFQRSGWSGQEKMVDPFIVHYVDSLFAMIGRIRLAQQLGVYGPNAALQEEFACLRMDPAVGVPRRAIDDLVQIVICAGDGDYAPLWTSTTSLFQDSFEDAPEYKETPQLHLWSWEHSLATVYQDTTLSRHVHLLDPHFAALGDTCAVWDTVRDGLPAARTFFLEHVADADVESRVFIVLDAQHVVYYHCWDKKPTTLAVILQQRGGDDVTAVQQADEVTAVQQAVARGLAADGLDVTVRSFAQRQTGAAATASTAASPLVLANSFAMLGDLDAMALESAARAPAAEPEMEEWTQVSISNKKSTNKTPKMRCNWRKYCPRGKSCTFGHTRDEFVEFDGRQRNRGLPIVKQQLCEHGDRCKHLKAPSKCRYAHGSADLFCTICGSSCGHVHQRCDNRDAPWKPS